VRHKQCGDTVWVAYVTDGRRSRALGLAADEMARRRRVEAEAAAAVLGLDRFEWLGCREGEWADDELRPRLEALVRRCAPDVIYAPSRVDFHPEHRRVAFALASSLGAAAPSHPLRVRVYQVSVPLTAVLTNLVGATSSVTAESEAAFRAYVTQQGSVGCAFRSRRYAARFYGLGAQAEEFWEMGPEQYRRLHRPAPEAPTGFRSLRPRSLGDPLAYLVGLADRRRLAAAIRGASEAG
jgi:LmbE family N-acetylglucosaminyl deacetylase